MLNATQIDTYDRDGYLMVYSWAPSQTRRSDQMRPYPSRSKPVAFDKTPRTADTVPVGGDPRGF